MIMIILHIAHISTCTYTYIYYISSIYCDLISQTAPVFIRATLYFLISEKHSYEVC